ncbi:hypothetical protein ACFVZV_11545, partial [Streptomyces bottropensis]
MEALQFSLRAHRAALRFELWRRDLRETPDVVPARRPRRPGPTPRRELNCGQGQVGYLIKRLDSAKAVAAELGVTADSVNRYRRGGGGESPRESPRKGTKEEGPPGKQQGKKKKQKQKKKRKKK